MPRWLAWMSGVIGWGLVLITCALPLAGMAIALSDPRRIATDVVAVPTTATLMLRSVGLAAIAAVAALVMAVAPAMVLGSRARADARSGRFRRAALMGLVLAPLLIPPQIYAYAWGLAVSPTGPLAGVASPLASAGTLEATVRSGLISAGWLWPAAAIILAAAWRTTGAGVYQLALLDASPGRAFLSAVLPSLRSAVLAAVCVVFAVAMLEYPIPHLGLVRVYATELMMLFDVGAPPGQILRMAVEPIAVVAMAVLMAAWLSRKFALGDPLGEIAGFTSGPAGRLSCWAVVVAAGVWAATVVVPAVAMLGNMRDVAGWRQAVRLLRNDWADSVAIAAAAGGLAVLIALGTVVRGAARPRWASRSGGRHWGSGIGMLLPFLTAGMPAAGLGIGFVVLFNRDALLEGVLEPAYLYRDTGIVWVLGLTARYAAIAVLIAWLTMGRTAVQLIEQARVDGAGSSGVVAHVLLPLAWRGLAAGGLIVALLALFEVVITQILRPVGFGSLSYTLLQHMHYGRDDVVIATSLLSMAAGVVVAMLTGALVVRRGEV